MTAPTAIIADDEPNLRNYLKEQLSRHWPELIILAEADNGQQALDALQHWQPDFAFLDIKMPALSGIEVARENNGQTHIIFVTAYDHYAIEAFENAAADYLLKPVSDERLQLTIERLKNKLDQRPADLGKLLQRLTQPAPRQYLQWIKAARGTEVELIAVEQIDYFHAADKYTTVTTQNGEWIIRTPLKELEKTLNPDQFWRIHRSTIIRVAAIESFRKTFSGHNQVKLTGHNKPLTVSRSHAERFKAD